jgi:hypothetical protein
MGILYLVLAGLLVIGLAVVALLWLLLTRRVEGAYFDSQGIPIHYAIEGSGPPVLLLHGFAVNGDINVCGSYGRPSSRHRWMAASSRREPATEN